jgi:small-conductance mechanosensitive channel
VVAVLEEVARGHETVCRDPEARARMRGFGDSSLDFELLVWVEHPSQRGLVSHELYMDIYKTLRIEGIEIPFPQRDVWMRNDSGVEGEGEPGGPS